MSHLDITEYKIDYSTKFYLTYEIYYHTGKDNINVHQIISMHHIPLGLSTSIIASTLEIKQQMQFLNGFLVFKRKSN